jgi:shikimate dehydrogenase
MTYYRLGLIGYPLEYSLSPQLHMAALRALNLEGQYDLFPLAPTPHGFLEIQALFKQVRQRELHGLNITIPHKMTVIPFLDELTPTARAIGAVNTIRIQGDKLVGDNYDCPGFIADLTHCLTHTDLGALSQRPDRKALVLGAGGSARAVVYGLLRNGWQVKIASRRSEQAQELVQAFPSFPATTYCVLDDLVSLNLGGIDLIVNTTPLGMYPNTEASAWPDGLPFPSAAFVYDLVYSPPETALLRSARKAGLPTANGLGMLVQQAVMSFHSWTGQEPPIEVMYRSINQPLPQYDHIYLPSLKGKLDDPYSQ